MMSVEETEIDMWLDFQSPYDIDFELFLEHVVYYHLLG